MKMGIESFIHSFIFISNHPSIHLILKMTNDQPSVFLKNDFVSIRQCQAKFSHRLRANLKMEWKIFTSNENTTNSAHCCSHLYFCLVYLPRSCFFFSILFGIVLFFLVASIHISSKGIHSGFHFYALVCVCAWLAWDLK